MTKPLTVAAIASNYELNTGLAIVRRFKSLDASTMPAVLVANHASFCWGTTVERAVEHASYLEEVATMAYHTLQIAPNAREIPRVLLDKHFLRKHGVGAYYGQRR